MATQVSVLQRLWIFFRDFYGDGCSEWASNKLVESKTYWNRIKRHRIESSVVSWTIFMNIVLIECNHIIVYNVIWKTT